MWEKGQGDLFCGAEVHTNLAFERLANKQGFCMIAGLDEAGRGPLAGPVVAAAVILSKDEDLPGVTDSKKLTKSQREKQYEIIMARAVAVGIGVSDHLLIDRINILQATLAAMQQAILNLNPAPDYLLIDGISKVPLAIPQKTIIKGDSASLSIAAASIVAKVTRDRQMVEFDRRFPGYGFASNKGYGSAAHMAAIARFGPCEIHRKSFAGVKEHVSR